MSNSSQNPPASEKAEYKNDNPPKPPPTYQSASKVKVPAYSSLDKAAQSASSTSAAPSAEPSTSAAATESSSAKGKKKASKAPPPLAPTDPHPGDDAKMAEFRAWGREKLYANDNFGGHKGVATGPANDPFKVFRWVGRKVRGVPTEGGRSKKWDTSARLPGETVEGDVETQRVA